MSKSKGKAVKKVDPPVVNPEVSAGSVDSAGVAEVYPAATGRSRIAEIIEKQREIAKRSVSVDQTGFSAEAADPLMWLRRQEPGLEWHMVTIPRVGSPTFNLETMLLQNYLAAGYAYLTVDMVSDDEGDDAIFMHNIVEEDGKIVFSNSYIMFMSAEAARETRLRKAQLERADRSGRQYDEFDPGGFVRGSGGIERDFDPIEQELQVAKVGE